MDDSREEGIEEGVLVAKRMLVINMLRENEAIDKICRIAECDETFVEEVKMSM